MNNRIPRRSRWPADPNERIARAMLDLDFIAALRMCGCDESDSWDKIETMAREMIDGAEEEIRRANRETKDRPQ